MIRTLDDDRCAIDILYGHRGMVKSTDFQSHRTGFTVESLSEAMKAAGYTIVEVVQEGFGLMVSGTKLTEGQEAPTGSPTKED